MTTPEADNNKAEPTVSSHNADATPPIAPSVEPCAEKPLEKPTEKTVDMAQIYLEIRASLTRYVSRYFKRSQEAEDVVQEAFVKVIQAQRQRDIQSPKSYLFRTARNLSLAQISKSSYKLTDEVSDILTDSEILMTKSMEDEYEVRENFEVFCSAVRALPVKCRRVFVLCRVYGFSQKEVASRMGITLSAVEGHLTRAVKRCVEHMEAEQSDRRRWQKTSRKEL